MDGWHIGALCEHLEALHRGDIRNLLVNVPPRTSKPVSVDAHVLEKTKGRIRLGDISVGDCVLTHTGNFRHVSEIHEQGVLPLLKISLWSGRTVRLAHDHPVLTPNGWIEARALKSGDVAANVVPQDSCGSDTVLPEEARLLGYLIGDGSCISTQIGFTNASEAVLSDVEKCAAALNFKTRRRVKSGCRAQYIIIKPETRQWGKGKVSNLKEWMIKHGIWRKSSYEKCVPPAIFAASDFLIGQFIGAYWSCDGFASGRGKNRKDGTTRQDVAIGCDSVNRDLLIGIQHLLLRLGVCARLRKKTAKLKTARQGGDTYVSYSLCLGSADATGRFASAIPIVHEMRSSRIKNLRPRAFHRVLQEDEIISIEEVPAGQCRCLTVDVDHSFVADDVAVHNSTTCSVMFPAWVWASEPSIQFLYTAYAQNISVRDSRRCRALIQSRWYQSRWGHQYQIVSDQDTKIRFDNDKNGYRIASSVEGQNTGEGGDYIVCVPGGTLISTEEGALPIEEIVSRRMDVRIRTFDHLRNQLSWSTIDNWHENGVRQLYSITTDSGHNLHLTGNHEVYLAGEGYVPTRALVRGDELVVGSEQPHISKLVETVKIGTARVYNLTLVPHRNYFANGLLVHNCDDPNNVRDQSDTVLDSTLDWWTNVMPTRLNDFKTGRRLVIQQRTHERDLSGHIMENDKEAKDWVRLILPMEFESKRRCITVKLPSTVGKWFDPRKSDGELLAPERIGPKELVRLKRELSALGGSYAISGQLQQRPAPDEGGIIKKAWFQLWKDTQAPQVEYTLMSVDTALTAKKTSAFSVATTWGIFKEPVTGAPNIILLSLWRDKVEYPELRARIQRMAADYLDDGPEPRMVDARLKRPPALVLIEAKVSGHSLIQDLARAGVFARPNDPDKLGDKLQRVRLITHLLEAGRVWVPANPPKFDKARAYAQIMIDQAAAFPNAASRDIVDTMTQALHFFQSFSFVSHPTDEKWEPQPRAIVSEAGEPLY